MQDHDFIRCVKQILIRSRRWAPPRTKVRRNAQTRQSKKKHFVASDGRNDNYIEIEHWEDIKSHARVIAKAKADIQLRDAHGPNASSNSHHASMRPHQKGVSSPWQDSVEIVLLIVHHTFSWQSLVCGPYMLVTCFALWADRTALHEHTGGTLSMLSTNIITEVTRVTLCTPTVQILAQTTSSTSTRSLHCNKTWSFAKEVQVTSHCPQNGFIFRGRWTVLRTRNADH